MSVTFCLTVDDVCLPGFSSVPDFETILGFLDEQGVPATFFVSPFAEGIPLAGKKDWVRVLREALDQGHDIQLHGLEHSAFEWGIPPRCVLEYEDEVRLRLANDWEALRREWTLETLVSKLTRAKGMLEEAIERPISVFRSPYGSYCSELWEALGAVGIRFSSTLMIDVRGWAFIRGDYETSLDWNEYVPPEVFEYRGVLEMPMMSEYTWYLTPDKLERHVSLAMDDLDRVQKHAGGLMVPLAHVSPLVSGDGSGLALYRRLFDHARSHAEDVTFSTLGEVAAGAGGKL